MQVPRDPRFLPVTGEFSADKFRSQYGFLSEMHEQEMKTLKDNLKRARKMLASSPRDLREEREQEVQRLERAVKRSESLVNRDRREKIEASALARARKEEKEKRMHGKGAWHMKNGALDLLHSLLLTSTDDLCYSGQKGTPCPCQVRSFGGVRGTRCSAEGHREEAKEGQPEREKEAAVRTWRKASWRAVAGGTTAQATEILNTAQTGCTCSHPPCVTDDVLPRIIQQIFATTSRIIVL